MLSYVKLLVLFKIFLLSPPSFAEARSPLVTGAYTLNPWATSPAPTALTRSSTGEVFVISQRMRQLSVIEGMADKRTSRVILSGLNSPSHLATHQEDLFFAEVHQLSVLKKIKAQLKAAGKVTPTVVKGNLPTDFQNNTRKFLIHDQHLYLALGAPCNVCQPSGVYATIQRMQLDGSQMETYASGIRHVGAMTVHPFTKRIWFTDQSRNKMGQNLPTSEVNILEEKADYGFPYVHGAGTKDPHFGVPMIGQKFTAPVADVRPHAQPTGIVFSNTQCFLLVTRGSQEEGASAEGRVEEFCPQGKGFTSRTLVTAGADNRLTDIIPYEKGWLISDDKQNMIWELRKK